MLHDLKPEREKSKKTMIKVKAHEEEWLTRTSAKKSFEQGTKEVCAVTSVCMWSDLSIRLPGHDFFHRPTHGFKAS